MARATVQQRTYHHSAFAPSALAGREKRVSVCLPARNEEATIGAILGRLMPLLDAELIDQVMVVDDSEDATADIAHAHGAEVHRQSELCPELGPVQGKGDAMWRALTVLHGDVICYLDADSEQFGPHYAAALAGAVALHDHIWFAKAFYRRPFRAGDTILPHGGGRVTELTARPLLAAFHPELAAIRQPLAGEIAAERSLLERIPFLCGYAVDVALLIDAYRRVGLAGLIQIDLDVRQNRHRSLAELGPMAHAVTAGVLSRLPPHSRPAGGPMLDLIERPPMADYAAARALAAPARRAR
jgi:glucosyl-3-phosphoglycerate synthase